MSPPRILILKTGDTMPEVRARRGDFDAGFEAVLGEPCRVVNVHRGEPLPLVAGLSGLLVTGSSALVSDPDAWIAEAAGMVLGAANAGVPILGVCFGHQLVADALGGRVGTNPNGREIGTCEISLTEAGRTDPLFDGLDARFFVQESHRDAVLALPPGATTLASNAKTAEQSFAIGEHVRCVQFHPEFDADVVRGYVDGRADAIAGEARARGEDPEGTLAAIKDGIADTPAGPRILRNWLRHFVR